MTPFFALCFADTVVASILGDDPMRLYPFGAVPLEPTAPYAVYREAFGLPENYLGSRTDIDSITVQVQVYGATGDEVQQTFDALRTTIEPHGHVVAIRGAELDGETFLVSAGFDVEFWVTR